jgi:hypothetical protein
MRTKLLLAVIGLAVSIVPTVLLLATFVLIAGIYLLSSEQTWQVNRFGEIWLWYRGGAVGFQPVVMAIEGCLAVVFFACLRVFLRERKEAKLEKKKSRGAASAYTI